MGPTARSAARGVLVHLSDLESSQVAEVMRQLRELLYLLEPDQSRDSDLRIRTDIEMLLAGYELGLKQPV